MTYEKLTELINKNNIPNNVTLMSDSGWECDPTDMDGVYYNETENIITFTQGFGDDGLGRKEYSEPDWRILWKEEGCMQTDDRNINNSMRVDDKIIIMPIRIQNYIKARIKESGDFRKCYGINMTDETYEQIDLKGPLFFEIFTEEDDYEEDNVGYVGLRDVDGETCELEIYIYEPYRGKGYGTKVLTVLLKYAKEGRLKIYDYEAKDIRAYIPKNIIANVQGNNHEGGKFLESNGFVKAENGDKGDALRYTYQSTEIHLAENTGACGKTE